MKSYDFDNLIRTLHNGSSRRAFLVGLAGGFLSTCQPGVPATAKHRHRHKRKKGATGQCTRGTKLCGTQCVAETSCCDDTDCPAGTNQTCQSGVCACPPGQQDSGGVCGTEPLCGSIGARCTLNSECCSQSCIFRCQSSQANQPCHGSFDCSEGLRCVGFVCRA